MRLLVTVSAISLLTACGGDSEKTKRSTAPAGETVLTTFYPTQYFAERIAGEHLTVQCPLPDDADPIFWRPDSSSLQKFQSADLIIVNGAEFEKWIATASLPESRIVDTAKPFEKEFIRYESSSTHKHGNDGDEHSHTGIDGHTWLDPINAKAQAGVIHQALAKKWPAHGADFEKNFQALSADLDGLDAELKKIDASKPLIASHPAYNYLARRYGWTVTNLDLDPEAMPDKDAIPTDHPAKLILWESQPRELNVSLLQKKYGLKSIVFSPAEQRGDTDYLETMRANITALAAALE